MPRKRTRRGMLYSIGATSAVALGTGTAVGSSDSGPPDRSNGAVDFDPGDLGQIRGFKRVLENANESARENVLDALDDEQRRAFEDSNKSRYTVHRETRTVETGGEAFRTTDREVQVHDENAHLPEKWGWEIEPVEDVKDVETARRRAGGPQLAEFIESDDDSGTTTYCHTVENADFSITRFEWQHCLTWDWSYTQTPYGRTDLSIDNVRTRARALDTGLGWTYEGVIHSDTYKETSNRGDEYVYSEKQGNFTYYSGIDSKNPHIDLRGSYLGNGSVVSVGDS